MPDDIGAAYGQLVVVAGNRLASWVCAGVEGFAMSAGEDGQAMVAAQMDGAGGISSFGTFTLPSELWNMSATSHGGCLQ